MEGDRKGVGETEQWKDGMRREEEMDGETEKRKKLNKGRDIN